MLTAQSIKFLLKNPTKLLFYLLVVIMPFITTSFTNESYEFPKVTFLYLVGGLFVVSFAWDAINQKISVQFDKRIQIVFAYFSIFILSTARPAFIKVWATGITTNTTPTNNNVINIRYNGPNNFGNFRRLVELLLSGRTFGGDCTEEVVFKLMVFW